MILSQGAAREAKEKAISSLNQSRCKAEVQCLFSCIDGITKSLLTNTNNSGQGSVIKGNNPWIIELCVSGAYLGCAATHSLLSLAIVCMLEADATNLHKTSHISQ